MLDAALMTGISVDAGGDTFDQVLRQRERQVLRTAYRVLGNWADAEDVAQEVFLRLHRHGLGFANEAALGGWLYRVTVNACLDKARRAKPVVELPETLREEAVAEAGLIRSQEKERLMAALATLPVRERAAVVLREIEGLSTAEVAAALGTKEATVRSQIFHAMRRLREVLESGKA
ncbi:MAG TPA: RNA polymerase sigma factor [Bryobacteraceae bacterium]|jgi:RNA polymerase sigma-70 factor (ECF subfamily)